MSLPVIYQRLATSDFCNQVVSWCQSTEPMNRTALQCRGTSGSVPAFLLHRLAQELSRPVVCILPDADTAAYLHSDLEQLTPQPESLLLFLPSGQKPYDQEHITDPTPLIRRADALQQLTQGFDGILVTSVDALFEMVPPPHTVQQETLVVAVGEEIAPQTLVERLVGQRFNRVEFVEEPGDLALRGGILDIYPFSGDYPIRIEFFGDEIDSIREFDARTQRSISRLTSARIVPNLEQPSASTIVYTALFDYLPEDTLLVTFDESRLAERTDELFAQAQALYKHAQTEHPDRHHAEPASRYFDGRRLKAAFFAHPRLLFGVFVDQEADHTLAFDARPQPAFNGHIDRLRQQIGENAARHIDTFILCDSRGQEARLHDLLEEEVEQRHVTLIVESLHEGFEVPNLGLAVYTDHQIFNRYHRPTARKRHRKQGGLSLRDLQTLSPGDFIVHIDYGIGKFAGLQKITVREKQQEAVRMFFAGDDVLYVNVNALYKLHKYTGKEGHQPRLTKLGSGQWERTKARTKKRVKDIARDLILLYARRKASKGHTFPADTVWQREMEASFEFEDTPDQATASEAVKTDLEEAVPMDRLVCGDVGFGKTEVAVRAAFKAAQEGKQVAVLVPTTVLARQHYETFKKRLGRFPVRIEMLSRFRSAKEQKQVVQDLTKGTVDIVVGTHRLVSKDVQFKDLGLLIIDEEQRFGVAVKERLRRLRINIDTLTLTATPIPRTLQFSLLGARDLSIINTPPPNRQPILTEIHTFDRDLIRDAILYEISRGGQVFFIHNRVQSIEEFSAMLRALVPDVRIQIAHGQMKPARLERVMMGFIDKKFDVLVSTSIIENGLDISNANTIIINNAQRFGLAELHQLRGRVGRSNRKAFCYLLVPSIHALTREARQRLQAVEEFSDLGSGFNIAMRDLDIRGAGNLLGGEQSGFIAEVGYETYHKILDEAVQELRFEEFHDLFKDAPVPQPQETTVDVEENALIPRSYLSNHLERLSLYRRISEAGSVATLEELRTEMIDRFGPIPVEVDNLLLAAEIKMLGQGLRLAKVQFKNQRLFLELPTQDADPHFYERFFHPLLEKLSLLDRRYVLRETKRKKLRAIVQSVPDLTAARVVLGHLSFDEKTVAA
ncbi:MAG: transcription-repair coupling factor [Rhodothermales bacterium]